MQFDWNAIPPLADDIIYLEHLCLSPQHTLTNCLRIIPIGTQNEVNVLTVLLNSFNCMPSVSREEQLNSALRWCDGRMAEPSLRLLLCAVNICHNSFVECNCEMANYAIWFNSFQMCPSPSYQLPHLMRSTFIQLSIAHAHANDQNTKNVFSNQIIVCFVLLNQPIPNYIRMRQFDYFDVQEFKWHIYEWVPCVIANSKICFRRRGSPFFFVLFFLVSSCETSWQIVLRLLLLL